MDDVLMRRVRKIELRAVCTARGLDKEMRTEEK